MEEIGLYIHIPFCKSKCLYCDFNSFEGRIGKTEEYITALLREFEAYQTAKNYKYKTVFIGGGTPTFIHYELIGRLMNSISPYLASGAEISMECNPGTVDLKSLKYYKASGINRLSIGLQAWQDELLAGIGRIHTVEEFVKEFYHAREAGFDNINVDLMFALPGQSLKMWEETLYNVCKLGVEHISGYSLKLEEGTRLAAMYDKGTIQLPDDELDRNMYHMACETLGGNGLKQYEISNFAKPGYECRHNLVYWNNQEYLGLGAGSHSKLENKRFWNYCGLEEYAHCINSGKLPVEGEELVYKEEEMWETIFLALRLNKGLDIENFNRRYSVSFLEKYNARIKKLIENNLVLLDERSIKLTDKGRDLSNTVFIEFL